MNFEKATACMMYLVTDATIVIFAINNLCNFIVVGETFCLNKSLGYLKIY